MTMSDHLAAAADLVRDLEAKLDRAQAEVDRIRTAIRAIHAPLDAVHERIPGVMQVCAGCGTDAGHWVRWPCRTVAALDPIRGGDQDA